MYGLKAWQEPGPNSHTQARACPVQADRIQMIGPYLGTRLAPFVDWRCPVGPVRGLWRTSGHR